MSRPKGFIMSEAQKKAISKASFGKPGTNTGKKFSVQWKENISRSLQGRIHLPLNKNPNWKGGKSINDHGYIVIAVGKGKRIPEHRLIIEKFLKRKLKPNEVIHHLDGDKRNNLRSNLKLFVSQKAHVVFEGKEKKFAEKLLYGNLAPDLKIRLQKLFKRVM